MPNGWKGSEIWRKIIWGIYYFRLFKSLWVSSPVQNGYIGIIAAVVWAEIIKMADVRRRDDGRLAFWRRTSGDFETKGAQKTKSETWNIILSRARIMYYRFHNHVSCFILFRKPFVDAGFRVKHDVSSWLIKIFMFHHDFNWIVFNFSLINLTQ